MMKKLTAAFFFSSSEFRLIGYLHNERHNKGFHGGSDDKESAFNAKDSGSIPGSERSPEEGNANPLQYSCLEISWTEDPGGLQSPGCKESDTKEQLTP